MMIAPILSFLLVFDPKENDINKDVNAFYIAFTVGYGVTFLLQILFTTAIRLGVFSWLEPDVFQLTPQVPSLVLPWVLRENRYRPKRITLFAADFATSCVACPIIEEYVKLKILQWSARLPRFVLVSGCRSANIANLLCVRVLMSFVSFAQELQVDDKGVIQKQKEETKVSCSHSSAPRRS